MHSLPLSFVLSLVLITAWLGASSWEPAELRDLFVLGGASPPAGLQVPLLYPNPWHLGTFLGCSWEHPASPCAQPGGHKQSK